MGSYYSHLIFLFSYLLALCSLNSVNSYNHLNSYNLKSLNLAKLKLSHSTLQKLSKRAWVKAGESRNTYWNPEPVYGFEDNDDLLLEVCPYNSFGNYPNPFNCQQFLMCAPGYTWRWECPASCAYLPFDDMCAWADNSECPSWLSVWTNEPVTCERYGQREWSSSLSLPAVSKMNCGTGFNVCGNFTTIDSGFCERGTAYSKAFFGCVPEWLCEYADKVAGVWIWD